MPMSPPEQFAAAQAAGFDILAGLTSKTLDGLQKVAELNLQTMKSTLGEVQENARKAFDAKDPGDLFALQASLMQPAAGKAQAYGRQLFEIAEATRADFAKVAEALYVENKRMMQEYIESATRGAPAGSEAAMAAWKSAMAATTSLFEAMQQTATRAVEVAESNLKVAGNAASNAAQQATGPAARAAKR
ncbi:TIGR01841 family phasin [Cupriavidus sp. BIC8F]|uniref:TIGR01841 family phasin n=1 Tax=Cupriavidus sp. BIC8F TaxID=3079014 RepID=UPI002916A9C0|nr:TIGR01841 family phasin [Cupriavidus sp. BIC8F]